MRRPPYYLPWAILRLGSRRLYLRHPFWCFLAFWQARRRPKPLPPWKKERETL